MTKVGFITTPLSSGHSIRGVGFYTRNLLKTLKTQSKKFDIEIVENGTIGCEIVHYPFFDLATHSLPLLKTIKTIVTIHDVIPLEYPEHYPLGVKGSVNLFLQKISLLNTSAIITDSYASVNSIHKHLGVPHSKLKLIYLAASDHFKPIKDKTIREQVAQKYHLPKKFVLYVGDVNYNKNIPNLVLACQEIGMPLVLVGKQAAQLESLDLNHPELSHLKKHFDLLKSYPLRLGFVPDEDLPIIYNLASVYCQPSFAEGFGLPVLEAMACGVQVACSNAHSLPEIAGEAAELFEPQNVKDITRALKGALTSKHPVQAQAAKFSWEKTAEQTLQVYRSL